MPSVEVDTQDFEDPLTMEIMADPVTCDDGNTYERKVIERVFQDRIRAEQERQDAEERRAREERTGTGHNNNNDDDDDDAVCCGARPPIQLTSPISGAVVSGRLVPNRFIERQIVRLVEQNALGMNEQEVNDWKERREEKIKSDRARYEERKREEEEEERRRRNAEEAEARRAAERESAGGGDETADTPPAAAAAKGQTQQQAMIRLDRNTVHTREKLCTDDLGFSVDLCEDMEQIVPEFLTTEMQKARCMVACCAVELEGRNRWCARCGRLACAQCLAFAVTDIQETPGITPRRICLDCLTNVVDGLDPSDIRARRVRVVVQRTKVDVRLKELTKVAGDKQDLVVRQDMANQYRPAVEELNREISRLGARATELRGNIDSANQEADKARNGARAAQESQQNKARQELEKRCRALSKELDAMRSKGPPEDEAECAEFFARMTTIGTELSDAEFDLTLARTSISVAAMASSSPPPPTAAAAATPQRGGGAGESLQAKRQQLESRRNELVSSTKYDPVARVVELSAIDNELEELYIQIALEDSQCPSSVSSSSSPSGTSGDIENRDVSSERAHLAAIGFELPGWPLPLGLEYPTKKVQLQLDSLRNALSLRQVESQRVWEDHFLGIQNKLTEQRDACEADVARVEAELQEAQNRARQEIANMEERREQQRLAEERRRQEEEVRRRQREERRRREEQARRERERQRQEQERKAREEAEALRRRNAEAEAATERAFATAGTSAATFGGKGQLKMCGRCKAGPFENKACADLASHNDAIAGSSRNANHCPNCGWFNPRWEKWPLWDGVHGPH